MGTGSLEAGRRSRGRPGPPSVPGSCQPVAVQSIRARGRAVATQARGQVGPWRRELNDLLRGMTGGFLIGIPLLYTMETWWIGETISPLHALLFLAVAYVVNLGFV